MRSREDVRIELRRANPYPSLEPLPSQLRDQRPKLEQVIGPVARSSRVRPKRNRVMGPIVAVAMGLGVIAFGLLAVLIAGPADAPPAGQPPLIEVTIPSQPVDPRFPVEPTGSGPALAWERAPLPFGGIRARWLAADNDRFYLSMVGSSQLGPGVYWLSSEDGHYWTDITPSSELPPLQFDPGEPNDDVTASNRLVIAVSLPEVFTLDTRTGRYEVQQLQLPDNYTDPQVGCHPDDRCPADVTVTAGDQGALILAEGAGWHSTDGFQWIPVREIPGDPIDVVAVDGGFVLAAADTGRCKIWHSDGVVEWEHIHTLSDCPRRLFAWNDQAVAVYLDSLWTISPSSVSPIVPEELSVLRGERLTIAAAEGGIVVPYDAIPPDWNIEDDGLWPPVNAIVEYSPDGRQWSRSVLSGEIAGSSVEIVGTTAVLLREAEIYIGTPES